MRDGRKQILLTNDDGIKSPGLWAAAEALSPLGFVTVVAPREQASGSGRSSPVTSDGIIKSTRLQIGQQDWEVYAVGGTPAQAVLHGILEIMPVRPDLVVSGINYGENIGFSITISGTVGAALEAAAQGIPALAVSLELLNDDYLGYSREVDFSAAAHFTHYFGQMLLEKRMPHDVDVLKLDVPAAATIETPWRMTRVARHSYYMPVVEREGSWDDKGVINSFIGVDPANIPHDTDAYTLRFDRTVAVTPLSLDLTSRVDLKDLDRQLRD